MAYPSYWYELAKGFRTAFTMSKRKELNWYPGHMAKGMKQMKSSITQMDCIVEVHDARIPISGRNPRFKSQLSGDMLPHILVLNKRDLICPSEEKSIEAQVRKADPSITKVIFTNCKKAHCEGMNSVLPAVKDAITGSDRFRLSEIPSANLLIVGIPNVGKSTLINIMRNMSLSVKGRASIVGNKPGVTRAVLQKVTVCGDPLIYLVDTPGILIPNIKDVHVGMKLALCNTISEKQIGEQFIADYLLFTLNKLRNFSYVDEFGLQDPTDDIRQLLIHVAKSQNMLRTAKDLRTGRLVQLPCLDTAAIRFVSTFRKGGFGLINLDKDMVSSPDAHGKKIVRLT